MGWFCEIFDVAAGKKRTNVYPRRLAFLTAPRLQPSIPLHVFDGSNPPSHTPVLRTPYIPSSFMPPVISPPSPSSPIVVRECELLVIFFSSRRSVRATVAYSIYVGCLSILLFYALRIDLDLFRHLCRSRVMSSATWRQVKKCSA